VVLQTFKFTERWRAEHSSDAYSALSEGPKMGPPNLTHYWPLSNHIRRPGITRTTDLLFGSVG
jgi:hypothetical protein